MRERCRRDALRLIASRSSGPDAAGGVDRAIARGRGVARPRERLFLLCAILMPLFFIALPSRLEFPAGTAHDGADHPLALPRTHAAPARRRAPRDRGRRGTFARDSLDRRGAAEPLLTALRHELRRARNPCHRALRPSCAEHHHSDGDRCARRRRLDRRDHGALEGSAASVRSAQGPACLPGLALQRLTTREPALADTQVALRAVASVLRREILALRQEERHQNRVDVLAAAAVVILAEPLALEAELLVEDGSPARSRGRRAARACARRPRAPTRPPARAERGRCRDGGTRRRPSGRDRRRDGSPGADRGRSTAARRSHRLPRRRRRPRRDGASAHAGSDAPRRRCASRPCSAASPRARVRPRRRAWRGPPHPPAWLLEPATLTRRRFRVRRGEGRRRPRACRPRAVRRRRHHRRRDCGPPSERHSSPPARSR